MTKSYLSICAWFSLVHVPCFQVFKVTIELFWEKNTQMSSVNRACIWHCSTTRCTAYSEAQISFLLIATHPRRILYFHTLLFLVELSVFHHLFGWSAWTQPIFPYFTSISHLAKSYFSNTGGKHFAAEMHTEIYAWPCRWAPKTNSDMKKPWLD